ncbi:MAG: hypothetical protein NXH75_15715, partial [Halobacteriovoraceae bacterium]|nr:hypothetical protein [Halobacteriovoraceae bacterium]
LVCNALEAEVNNNLPSADQSNYLKGMANASVASQRGLGANYGHQIDYLEVGFAATLGADLGDVGTSDLIGGDVDYNQVRGVGVGAAVSLALKGENFASKLGPLDMKRTRFYAYFLKLDAPDTDGLDGDTTSMGLHVQYHLVPEMNIGFGSFGWGGVALTTGFERASMNLKFIETLTESASASGQTASFNGVATVGAEVTTYNVPIEISTNVKFMYVFSLFGGMGADFAFGKAKSVANVTGNVTVSGGGTGDATLDLGTEESPSLFNMRGFIGTDINLTAIKGFVMLNKSFTNDTVSVSIGTRLGF